MPQTHTMEQLRSAAHAAVDAFFDALTAPPNRHAEAVAEPDGIAIARTLTALADTSAWQSFVRELAEAEAGTPVRMVDIAERAGMPRARYVAALTRAANESAGGWAGLPVIGWAGKGDDETATLRDADVRNELWRIYDMDTDFGLRGDGHA